MLSLNKIAERAKIASRKTALLPDRIKKAALTKAASLIVEGQDEILKANQKDLNNAKKKKLSAALTDRLTLNAKRIGDMAKAVREIALLPDPNGEVVEEFPLVTAVAKLPDATRRR